MPPDAAVVVVGVPDGKRRVVVFFAECAGGLGLEGANGDAERFCHALGYMQDSVEVVWHDAEGGDGDLGVVLRDAEPEVVEEPAVGVECAAVIFALAEPRVAVVRGYRDHVERGGAVVLEWRAGDHDGSARDARVNAGAGTG